MSSSTLLSRRDLAFLLHDWLDVGRLTERPRYAEHSRETFDAVLDLAAQVAAERFATHNRAADATEPSFDGQRVRTIPQVKAALQVFAETGREVEVKAKWTGFEIPDKFVVGYGIDYAQRNRNLPHIGAVRFT